MKITHIVLKGMPFGGGIEKYAEEIGSRLAARGHDITIFTMRHYGTVEGEFRGMRIRTVPSFSRRSLEKITASLFATIRSCMLKGTDLFHFHAFGPAVFCFVPILLGKRVVVQGHGLEWKRTRWGLGGRLFLKITEIPSIRVPHALTVVSKVQQQYIRERYNRDSVYIPTGVNPPTITDPDLIRQFGLHGNDYILFAARLVREKGAHYLIKAYNKLNPEMKLVITGDAAHEERYKSELMKLASGNRNIIFTGFASGKLLHELFSNCYIFVLPSQVEGLPTALLEAMSYGNCCLVSDIPENIEAISNFGLSFKSMDIDDLADKLYILLRDREKANSVKQGAREYVLDHYSWDKITDKFEIFYRSILEKKSCAT